MSQYTLWNIKDQKVLKHPKYGVWACGSKAEAEEALKDLFDYLEHVGMTHMKTNFSVIEVDQIKHKIN